MCLIVFSLKPNGLTFLNQTSIVSALVAFIMLTVLFGAALLINFSDISKNIHIKFIKS
jgi:hypothetical protein